MNTVRSLHLHGPGRAGTSLARILQSQGVSIASVSGGGESSRAQAASVLGSEIPSSRELPAIATPGFLLVAVPDDALAECLCEVAAGPLPAGLLVFHLSGVHGLEVYPDGWPGSAGAGAFHPLRSFPSRDSGGSVSSSTVGLDGCLVAVEARADEDRAALQDLARSAGGQPVCLKAGGRAAWHLGASLMGNAVPALFGAALEAFRSAGVPEDLARSGLVNLSGRALANAERLGVASALTGPVVRGDIGVLTHHLQAVSDCLPARRSLYLDLVRLQLDAVADSAEPAAQARVRRWLEDVQE